MILQLLRKTTYFTGPFLKLFIMLLELISLVPTTPLFELWRFACKPELLPVFRKTKFYY